MSEHMQNEMHIVSQFTEGMNATLSFAQADIIEDSTMPLVTFVGKKFIPNHVELKSLAGRTHYHAILKHILRPESVDRLFAPYVGMPKARLKAVPGWPYLDDLRLCDLNPDHVRQLTASASSRGYSSQTVKHIKNVISAIISHAKREKLYVGENPITAVELPPLVHKKQHDLTIIQAKTILKMLRYPEREIALVSMTTGMSISEICALKWKHINLTQATIRIDGDSIPATTILVRKQWGNAGMADLSIERVRMVVVPDPLIRALIRLKRSQRITDPECLVITSQEGNPIEPANARMLRLKPIGRQLQMPWLSWQVLKRAHDGLLSELRLRLTDDLVVSAR
jgi:integrase